MAGKVIFKNFNVRNKLVKRYDNLLINYVNHGLMPENFFNMDMIVIQKEFYEIAGYWDFNQWVKYVMRKKFL
ncbi:hypothetical protein SAMN06296427_108153 [Moheibacter sediminis]|uniref:Uncharacterized protein n=1 Tax=Moheibacter sediminis TaxID=1434700 RepID=A0A1W2C589_9FLAO|nr:hypothetical protein SAMN06296427_108153 [Moheibacter sediminis]